LSARAAPSALARNASRILPLAWPIFIGQLSVLAFATVDTLLVARHSAEDLAALAVGSAAYVTVFVGFMGIVLALSPIVGQLFGSGQLKQAGRQLHQAVWVALGLSLLGSLLLSFPGPILALAQLGVEVDTKVRSYLMALALSLPASLLFTVYRGFNTAVSRPKAVMVLQLCGLALKIPLSWALVTGVPALGLPPLGVLGCGISTCVVMWLQAGLAAAQLWRDPYYQRFELHGRRLDRPDFKALREHLRLGLPMGLAILVEVTAFAFMAIFIARLGTTSVAAHQLVANLVSILFMAPLALGSAISTLVAQSLGADQPEEARQLGWHGLGIGTALAMLMGAVVFALREPVLRLYTADPVVLAIALSLLAWMVVFHVFDAVQTIAAFVLRAHKVAVVPVLVYVAALWGVGLLGGCALAFAWLPGVPQHLLGAPGFWAASTLGLVLASLGLCAFLFWLGRAQGKALRAALPAAR